LIGRVLCPQVFGEINIDETPLAADLGAGDLAGLGPGLQRVRVQAKEGGGFGQIQGAHAYQMSHMLNAGRPHTEQVAETTSPMPVSSSFIGPFASHS